MQGNLQLDRAWGSPPASFINSGTLRKSVGGGTGQMGDASTDYNIQFSNAGQVVVQSGTLNFYGGGPISGGYQAAAGMVIGFESGDWVAAGPLISGQGQVRVDGTTLTLPTAVVPGLVVAGGTLMLGPGFQGGSITNLTLSGLTLLVTNQVTGVLNWQGGTLSGALTVASNGLFNITSVTYLSGVLTNWGTVAWSGGYFQLLNGSVVQNLGLWDMQGNLQLDRAWGSPPASFINSGTLRKSVGGGTGQMGDASTDYNIQFSNAGQVVVQSGTLNFYGGGPMSGSYIAGSGAAIGFNAGIWTPVPAFTFSGPGNVQFSADSVLIAGTIQLESGTISVLGTYSNGPSPTLVFSVGGSAPGAGYGQMQFSNPMGWAGLLSVTTRAGYRPNPGDTFQVLSYPSATGAFTCLDLDLGGGILLQPQFGPTHLNLIATSYDTNSSQPQLFITRAPGGVLLTWPLGFPNWGLQSSTNLPSTNWAPVPNPCGNQATVPTTAAEQFFRLMKMN
jgi:hypothetical protein